LLKLQYTYSTAGQTNNNGNVRTQTITAPKTASGNLVLTQNYTYDALNRLSFAEELISTTSQWKQTYDIDRWGNRAVRNDINYTTYIPNPSLTPQSANSTDFSAFDQTTNRLNPSVMPGFGYDPSGDVKSDPNTPANGIAYDAENRQTGYPKTGAGTTSYGYDGDGRRVKRTNPDNSAAIFVYNSGGQLIAEYTSGTPSGSGTSYLTSDHLGSTRVVTSAADGSGNVTVKARFDYLPFGEEIGSDRGSRSLVTGYVTSDKTRQKFTQKERDSESGLDYFGDRYYSNAEGRFTSVDPGNYQARRTPNDPQSWNGYSYVNNNPLTRVDLDGRGFWEKFKNWIDGEGWRTNAEVEERYQALEDKWRNWLREREKEAGGNLIWCTGQGSCWKVEIDTLSRNGVFRYAATLKQSIEEGTVQHFSAEEVSRIAASTLNVPQRALETLQQIESTGRQNPPNGYRGNGPFDNDGRNGGQVLPKTDASGNTITYKEWDVNPYQKGVNRGTERLVTGTDGSAYYSNDHYLTFVKVK
jgi:RHS repeat-associated protein